MEKSSLMMIVIIVLLVALLATVVFVTFYAFNLVQNMEAGMNQAAWDRTERDPRPDEINRIMIGEPIITNLATETGGIGPMARIQLVVGYDNTQGRESTDISNAINEHMTHIRMLALDSIGSRTYRDLSARDGRQDLAEEILRTLQNDFMTNMIVEVGFYEFILP